MTPGGHILAIHPGALGDVVLLGRVLQYLRSEGLAGRVTVVTGSAKARLLAGLGQADLALDFESLGLQELFSDTPVGQSRLAERLGALGRVDTLLSFFPAKADQPSWARLVEICGAKDAHLLPVRPPAGWGGHLVELWLEALGLPARAEDLAGLPDWPVPAEWQARARRLLQQAGPDGPIVALHPGAGGEDKCYPLEAFLTLAAGLAASGRSVAWLLGPVELDRYGDDLAERCQSAGCVLAGLDLQELAGVLARSSLLVGHDTGPSHLAAVLGVKNITCFKTTNLANFRPLGRFVRCVKDLPTPTEMALSRQF